MSGLGNGYIDHAGRIGSPEPAPLYDRATFDALARGLPLRYVGGPADGLERSISVAEAAAGGVVVMVGLHPEQAVWVGTDTADTPRAGWYAITAQPGDALPTLEWRGFMETSE